MLSEAIHIRTAGSDDLERVTDLLRECDLPVDDVEEILGKGYVIAEHGAELVGVCGIEVFNPYGLLRSLAVSTSWRGRSAGLMLVNDRIAWARTEGMRSLYLLTIDANRYFEQFGFGRIDRDGIPDEIKGSREFSALCPETAVVMVKSLND
jgi:amino-acid N-acetyltransferase